MITDRHPALVLRPSFVPEKAAVNLKRRKSKIIFAIEIKGQPEGVKSKTNGRKLRSSVKLQGE